MFYFFITVLLRKKSLSFTASLKGQNKERKCGKCYTTLTFAILFYFTYMLCLAPETTAKYNIVYKSLISLWVIIEFISFTNFNAQFLYSLTICMLHYNPRHVSSISMPIFRWTNCTITASGIVTPCKRLYSMLDESRLLCTLLSSGILYCTVLYRE